MKFSLFPREYVVFDFETTGLDPDKDEVIEIGATTVLFLCSTIKMENGIGIKKSGMIMQVV